MRSSVLAFLLLCGGTLSAQQSAEQAATWNRPVKPCRIMANLYYVGAFDLTSYLIVTPNGDILIDGGLPETAPRIERSIAALGFKIRDVQYLLNSHAHFDHAGGLAELKRLSGAQMVASRADAPFLTAGRQVYFSTHADSKFPPVKVDRIVEDGETVSLGGTTLTAHLTPGHTKGCTTWTMPLNEGGRTYNVVFFCSTSAPDYLLAHNPKYPEIAADYQQSFIKLEQIPCDVFLAPHGSFFNLSEKRAKLAQGGPNPFVDPNEFKAFIERSKQEFGTELRKQRASHS